MHAMVVVRVRLPQICIIAIISCVLLTGCNGPYPDSYWIHYTYHLDVYSENNSLHYQILLPIPINDTNETDPGFLDNIETAEGNFSYGTNQTIQGQALAVTGSGDIGLDIDFDRESDHPMDGYPNLSMLDDYRQDEDFGFFWVFTNAENISIHLTYWYTYQDVNYEYTSLDYEILSMLRSGWQRVPATIEEFEVVE